MGVPRRRRAGGSTGLREMRLGGVPGRWRRSLGAALAAPPWFPRGREPDTFECRRDSMGRIGAPRAASIFVEPVRQKTPRLHNRELASQTYAAPKSKAQPSMAVNGRMR